MIERVPLQQMAHGEHFRASTLRDVHGLGVLDPVLGVDHAWVDAPTFPPHPHAGFSAVSYVFADADTGLANQDSLGTKNLILPGGLHWTAAGRGIVHEEVPAEPGKRSHLLQIFVNLPRDQQAEPPYALSLAPQDVPVVDLSGAVMRIPIGRFGTKQSPLKAPTDLTLLDIVLKVGVEMRIDVPPAHNAFVLPITGEVWVEGVHFSPDGQAIPAIAASAAESAITLSAPHGPVQIALFHGPPLRQPVFWHGPMAMASTAALDEAARGYSRGDFGHVTPFRV